MTATPPSFRQRIYRQLPTALLILLTVAGGCSFARVFGGEPCGADASHHLSEIAFIARSVRAGDFNLWNPAGNGGFPTGYFYPLLPSAVPGLLAALFGGPLFWFQLAIFCILVAAPAVAYFGLRVMGVADWTALGGAIAVASFAGQSSWGAGADGMFGRGLYAQGAALCLLPLAIGYGWRWLVHGRGAASAVLTGLVVGLCHPLEGLALGLLLTAAVPFAIASQREGRELRSRSGAGRRALCVLFRLTTLGVCLLMGSAASWLPTLLDYEAFGGFPHRSAEEAGPGFAGVVDWLMTGALLDFQCEPFRLFTWSMLPALVAAIGLLIRRRVGHLCALWAGALTLLVLIGAGNLLVLTPDDLFPAVRLLGPAQIALALAVGSGAAEITCWCAAQLARIAPRRATAAKGSVIALAAIAALLAIVPAIEAHGRRKQTVHDYPNVPRAELDQLLPAIRAAAPGRMQNGGGPAGNHWMTSLPFVYAGRSELVVPGGAALQSSANFAFIEGPINPQRAAWIYDAPLVLTSHGEGRALAGVLLASTERLELRRLPAPGLVAPIQIVGKLGAGRVRARGDVLLWQVSSEPMNSQHRAYADSPGLERAPSGDISAVARGPSTIRASLSARAPTTFVIRESWHPRWIARLDGVPVAVRRVTPSFMAIDAPAGAHALELTFKRPAWAWALWSLVPGFAAAAAVLERVVSRNARDRSRQPES